MLWSVHSKYAEIKIGKNLSISWQIVCGDDSKLAFHYVWIKRMAYLSFISVCLCAF